MPAFATPGATARRGDQAAPLLPALATRFVKTTAYDVGESTNIKWHESHVTRDVREKILGQKGCVLWFTGLSGSGKSTLVRCPPR